MIWDALYVCNSLWFLGREKDGRGGWVRGGVKRKGGRKGGAN